MKKERRLELRSKEIDKMVGKLRTLLNLELQKKLEETKQYLAAPEVSSFDIGHVTVAKLAKECTIEIPITKYIPVQKEFSREETEAIERVEEIKKSFQLTQEELARILGVSLRTVAGWLHSESGPRPLARDRISKAYEVNKEITEEIRPQSLRKWLFAHNELLGDSIYNLLVKGEFGKILADIKALKEGVYI